MKILYILGPTMTSGALISFKIILEGMIRKGAEIVVLVSRRNQNNDFINYLNLKGCIVESFNAEAYVYPKASLYGWQHSFVKFPWRLVRKLFKLYTSEKEVLRLISHHQPDVVHTNVGVYRQGFYSCKQLQVPHVWHLREYQTKDFGWHILPSMSYFQKLLQSANVITITSDILQYFDLSNNRSAIALWDAVLPQSELYYKEEKKHYFLCANRVSPEKKVEDIISAFSLIASKLPADYKLIIVGEQSDEHYIKTLNELIEKTSYSDRIEMRQHQSNVIGLMQDAAALIVASRFEGLGRMTLEANFKGCLVLGRATGGTKEILKRTKGGFLFNTVDELGELMLHTASIIEDKVICGEIIKNAQSIVVESVANDKYNDRVYDFYNYVVKKEHRVISVNNRYL